MANLFSTVNSGDLITANLMNQILNELNSLETRVTNLESAQPGSGGVPVVDPLPSTLFHIGDTLTVSGENFSPLATTVVSINEAMVGASQFLGGSGDTKLVFQIPVVQNLDPGGTPVKLTVSNPNGVSAPAIFTLAPQQVALPDGDLFVALSAVSPAGKITAGTAYSFSFTVRAITSEDETYTLTPFITAPSSENWPIPTVSVSGQQVSQYLIPQGLAPNGSTITVSLALTVPAAGTTAAIRLAVVSTRNPAKLSSSSGDVAVAVSGTPVAAQDAFSPCQNTVLGGTMQTDGTVVVPATGSVTEIDYVVWIRDAGTYTVQVPAQPATNWTASIHLVSNQLVTTGPGQTQALPIRVTAASGAAPVDLTITTTSGASTWTYLQPLTPK